MATVALKMTADTLDAQEQIKKLVVGTTELKSVYKSLGSLEKGLQESTAQIVRSGDSFSEWVQGTMSLSKSTNDVISHIERFGKATALTKGQIAGLTKEISLYNDAIFKSTMSGGQSTASDIGLSSLVGNRDSAVKQLDELKASIASTEQETKKFSEQARNNALVAMGDNAEAVRRKMDGLKESIIASYQAGNSNSESTKMQIAQYKQLGIEYEKLSKKTTTFGVRITNLVKSFVSAQAVVYLLQKAVALIVKAFTEWTQAASKAEETTNLFNVVFQDTILSANKVVNDLTNRLKLAKSSAQEILASAGDLGVGFQMTEYEALNFSETVAKLVLDLQSFKNIGGDTTENVKTFITGLTGATRNLLRYGIVVKQVDVNQRLAAKGLDKLTGSALEQAKIQERLNIALEQSPNALGDMERTLNSTENITRRLKEQQKTLNENIGGSINSWLTPAKKIITEIIQGWNDATEARRRYEQNDYTPVYDTGTPEGNKSFKGDVSELLAGVSGAGNNQQIEATKQNIESARMLMVAYGASAEEVINAVKAQGYTLSTDAESQIRTMEFGINQQIRLNDELEVRKRLLSESASEADKMIDAMSGIKGSGNLTNQSGIVRSVSSNPQSTESDSDVMGAAESIQIALDSAIKNAIQNVSNASWGEFVSPIKNALSAGDDRLELQVSGLNEKLKQTESLYETIYNEALKDSELNETELANLASIVKNYQAIEQTLSDITAEKERQKKFNDAKIGSSTAENGLRSQAYITDARTANNGIIASEDYIKLYAEYLQEKSTIDQQYSDKMLLAATELEKAKTTDERDAAIEAINKFYNPKLQQQQETDKKSFDTNYWSLITGMSDSLRQKSDREIKYSDQYEQARNVADSFRKLNEQAGRVIWTEEEITANTNSYRESLIKLADKTEKQAAKSDIENSLNPFASVIESYNKGKTAYGKSDEGADGKATSGFFAGTLGFLADIVTQTEAFGKLTSFVTDYVVPMFDQFLAPILPLVEVLGQTVQLVFYGLLKPLFEPLKTVMKAILTIMLIVNIIQTTITWLWDNISICFGNVIKAITFQWRSFQSFKTWDELSKSISELTSQYTEDMNTVESLTMDVVRNTSKDDSDKESTYNELYQNGIIDATQWQSLMKGLNATKYDTVKYITTGAQSYNTYTGSTGTTTVNYGGVTIQISGADASSEASIRKVVLDTLASESAYGGSRRYA